jgi:hypothetical protein
MPAAEAKPNRLLMVSFDYVNAGLLDLWSSDGRLPNLSRLRDRGTVARLTVNSVSVEGDYATF